MRYREWLSVSILLVHIQHGSAFDKRYCAKSLETMSSVQTCPSTKAEMEEAAKRKECALYAKNQTCSEPWNFKYHCVINVFRNESIEVCAPERKINGYCTEFNVEGARIQDHFYVDCTTLTPPCPQRYNSTDAYLYPVCYNRSRTPDSTFASQTTSSSNFELTSPITVKGISPESDKDVFSFMILGIVFYVVMMILTVILIVLITTFRIRKKKRKPRLKLSTKTETTSKNEESSLLVLDDIWRDQTMEPCTSAQDVMRCDLCETAVVQMYCDTCCVNLCNVCMGEHFSADPSKPHKFIHFRNRKSNPLHPGYTSHDKEREKTFRVPIQEGTTTDMHSFITEMSIKDLAEENIETTRRYLKCYTQFDKYFVETQMYRAAKECLDRNNIVVMTGPPGSGKTIAAIHLLFEAKKNHQVLRKIRSWTDFDLVDPEKKTTVFIDNIFNETDNYDLENWWNKLDEIFDRFIKNEMEDSDNLSSKNLHLIITARESMIGNACTFMKRTTPVFNVDFIKHSNDFPLSSEEKDDIFGKQIEFAKNQKHMAAPTGDTDEFRKEMKEASGPIGFPLCAHLYACKEEYRQRGAKFFSHPIEFLKIQIKDEVRRDDTPKTKTLFFVIFLLEWHLKMHDPDAKLNLGSEVACRRFVNDISTDLLQRFNPLDFKDLTRCAQKLSSAFFMDVHGGGCRYIHDSVFEAVGTYFCDAFFEETVRFFPFDIIQTQEYSSLNKQQTQTLAMRFLYEALNCRFSKVYSSNMFRRKLFVDCFCEELERKSVKDVISFFSLQNESSNVGLPTLFWASFNNHDYLTDKFCDIILKHEGINSDYHFYLSTFGECCSKNESIVGRLDGMLVNNVGEIKKRVLEFKDEDQNTILHLLIMSDRSDRHVEDAVSRLIKGKASVNVRNNSNMTPLMLAARHKSTRTAVISKLIEMEAAVKYKDINGSNVFHHCLKSDNNDETCARNLSILLGGTRSKHLLNSDDNDGESALNIAAKQQKHSRILSILMLLECKDINTSTINLDGCSPIYNVVKHLKVHSPLVELECCARVIILTLYGVDPTKVVDDQTCALDICCKEYVEVKTVLENPDNIEAMESALNNLIQNVINKEKDNATVDFPNISNRVPECIKKCIKQAVQLLATVEFKLLR